MANEPEGCIFCRGGAGPDHREHILPDSMGGDGWGVLPPGLVCRSCNNYFGAKVEQRALASFPFLVWRVLLGMPTKKHKQPWMDVLQGRVGGSGVGGYLTIDAASPHMRSGIENGTVTTMRVPAHVTEPQAVSQLLLKIGLEIVASHDAAAARGERYDAARQVARYPAVGDRWAFLLELDDVGFMKHLNQKPTIVDSLALVEAEVSEVDGGDYLYLGMPGCRFLCPLEEHTVDESMRHLPSPTYQLYEVVFGRRS